MEPKKIFFILSFVLFLNLSLVSAITQQEIDEAKNFIDSEVDCNNLTDEQLEILGEYYMEQMHPGEAHELMHQMMGLEEGSNAEEQFHINIAKQIYCNENFYSGYGMMGGNMMGYGGMMNMMYGTSYSGMMGNYRSNFGYWNFFTIFYLILLIGLIILVILLVIKLWKSLENKKGRK